MGKAAWIILYISLFAAAVSTALGTPLTVSKEVAGDSSVAKVRSARQAGGCDCALTVYDNTHFGGTSLLVSQQNAHFSNDYFNDRVESVRIAGSCSWLMYTDANFAGTTYLLTPGDYSISTSWGGSGNKISSARALPPSGTAAIVLFQHSLFRGRMLTLYNSESSLPSLEFNDQLSSFIITGGTWKLYQHTSYSGNSATYSGPSQYQTLPSNVANDYVSSVQKL